MNKKQKITFIPSLENFKDSYVAPVPAISLVPEWYKSLSL
jgi:hypothetical protein